MSQMSMDDFNVGVTLGTGSFGRVRFAVEKATGTSVAVKMLKKSRGCAFATNRTYDI